MTDNGKLYSGITKAAWGYFFIYFDFNINGVSALPSFIGYMLFLSAINMLSGEERELNLLRGIGRMLTAWHVMSWMGSWVSLELEGAIQGLDIIIGVVNIYFHFQLLTNLASIAHTHQIEGKDLDKRLLRYRTLQTVMLTSVIILSHLSRWFETVGTVLSVGMILVYLIAGVLLMKALFELRGCIPKELPSG